MRLISPQIRVKSPKKSPFDAPMQSVFAYATILRLATLTRSSSSPQYLKIDNIIRKMVIQSCLYNIILIGHNYHMQSISEFLNVLWIISNISPHDIQDRGSDQAVFDNKWVKVRPGELEYVSHDGSASTGKVVGQLNYPLLISLLLLQIPSICSLATKVCGMNFCNNFVTLLQKKHQLHFYKLRMCYIS